MPSDRAMLFQDKVRNRDIAIITLIIGIGIKSSECSNLNIDDINLEHNYLIIRSRKTPNQIYFSKYIGGILSKYLKSSPLAAFFHAINASITEL